MTDIEETFVYDVDKKFYIFDHSSSPFLCLYNVACQVFA